ncbi:DUF6520 family protein [Flagellimonas sp.]|uniref:DUF6520 family protein n=1 Tax=Flagellimonas sp. TaxID=2058762 RepID=UPI003AB3752B
MKNRKLKMIAPFLTLVFAISGAFATKAVNNTENLATVPGYIDHPFPCEMAIECVDTGGPACLDSNGNEVFGKENPNATTCQTEVFRLEP